MWTARIEPTIATLVIELKLLAGEGSFLMNMGIGNKDFRGRIITFQVLLVIN